MKLHLLVRSAISARWAIPLLLAVPLMPATPAAAQRNVCRAPDSLPEAVRPFVERGKCVITLERSDLDLDELADYLLVLERPGAVKETLADHTRVLLVLTASPDGRLRQALRSKSVVLCSLCGGPYGNPYEGLVAKPGGFTVYHYGGGAWRWRLDFTFGYSPRARAWQLTRITRIRYHSSRPEVPPENSVYRMPRNYVKFDLRDFDVYKWNWYY